MKFDVVVGNPPYNSGRKQIYPAFIKQCLQISDYVIFIIPTAWLKNLQALPLRQWLCKQGVALSIGSKEQGNFSDVKTITAIIEFSKRNDKILNWCGKACIWPEDENEIAWLNLSESGQTLNCTNKNWQTSDTEQDAYVDFKREPIVKKQKAKSQLVGETIVLIPEFLGTGHPEGEIRRVMRNAKVMPNRPFNGYFVGFSGGEKELQWIQSEEFIKQLAKFYSTSHLNGSLMRYFVKKDAWEKYINESNKVQSSCQSPR